MIGERVVIITPGTQTDRYGNETPVWTGAQEQIVDGAGFAPGGMSEDNNGRTAVIENPTVYLPPGTVVSARCRVRVRGATYEAIGDPGDWRNPFTGWRPGVVLQLRRVQG